MGFECKLLSFTSRSYFFFLLSCSVLCRIMFGYFLYHFFSRVFVIFLKLIFHYVFSSCQIPKLLGRYPNIQISSHLSNLAFSVNHLILIFDYYRLQLPFHLKLNGFNSHFSTLKHSNQQYQVDSQVE